jgi:hypothetical protein
MIHHQAAQKVTQAPVDDFDLFGDPFGGGKHWKISVLSPS